MRRLCMLWICILVQSIMVVAAEVENTQPWRTYRSEKYGYELSYPEEMEYVAYFEGSSGELIHSQTGDSLARFEVWPPSKCSVSKEERTGPTARQIGIRRAGDITWADGPGSSSHCSDPQKVRRFESTHAAGIYELELSCINEEYTFEYDDETDPARIPETADVEPVITFVGTKGPTYFADISQSWLKRVLMADPTGVDPRQADRKNLEASDRLRKILETLHTFPVPEPAGICIQDLR